MMRQIVKHHAEGVVAHFRSFARILLGNHPAIGFREFHNAAFHIHKSNGRSALLRLLHAFRS